MINLAGNKKCDEFIRQELIEAGISIINTKSEGEVPYSIEGKINKFSFKRAWYYWVVKGQVPLNIAEELYINPIGKKDIRVEGNCTCPPPSEWAFPISSDLRQQLINLKIKNINLGELARLCDKGVIKGKRFINTYHIDSQEGLNLFVKTIIKKYK